MHTRTVLFCTLLLQLHCAPADRSPAAGPTTTPAAEPVACTEIGCSNGLEIEFVRGTWPAGDYRVQVDVDGAMTSCTGALPLNDCASGNSFDCSGASGVRLNESGCALPATGQSLAGLSLDTTQAKRVTLTLEHAGALIGTTTLEPEFREVQPNGAKCPPVCTNAGMRLKLR